MNLWEENVLRGNAAILKCHIPSFVTEYVAITSWIISEGDKDVQEINLDSDSNLGNDIRRLFTLVSFPYGLIFVPWKKSLAYFPLFLSELKAFHQYFSQIWEIKRRFVDFRSIHFEISILLHFQLYLKLTMLNSGKSTFYEEMPPSWNVKFQVLFPNTCR